MAKNAVLAVPSVAGAVVDPPACPPRTHGPVAARGAALFVALVSGACAGRAVTGFGASPPDEPVVIEVDNHNFLDVNVYLMPDGTWHRLGTVTGAGSATMTVPRGLIPPSMTFRLLVSPIGSPAAYLSEDIHLIPGDVVKLEVGAAIGMSSWSVAARRERPSMPAAATPLPRDLSWVFTLIRRL